MLQRLRQVVEKGHYAYTETGFPEDCGEPGFFETREAAERHFYREALAMDIPFFAKRVRRVKVEDDDALGR